MQDPKTIITVTRQGRSYLFQGGAWRPAKALAEPDDYAATLDLWSLKQATPAAARHDLARDVVAKALDALDWPASSMGGNEPAPAPAQVLEVGAFA